MPEKGIIFGETATKQIAKTVREHARRTVNEKPHRGRWQQKEQGGASSWGIVRADLDCGFYSIELGKFSGQPPSPSASGSGDICDPCIGVINAGTAACALEISAPASQVIGNGRFVTAYDPFSDKIKLIVGTDCIVERGGTAPEADIEIWKVLNGYHEHIVQYKERGECCDDGVYRILGKTPIIMLGHECDEILCDECPGSGSVSGSGA